MSKHDHFEVTTYYRYRTAAGVWRETPDRAHARIVTRINGRDSFVEVLRTERFETIYMEDEEEKLD